MASSETNVSQSLIDQFCAITGSTGAIGKTLLEACNGNLEMAIGMHMDSGETDDVEEDENTPNPCALEPPPGAATPGEEFPDVRAPIPQRHEVLVDAEPTFGFRGRQSRRGRSIFDGFRDFEAETRHQEQQLLCASTSTNTSTKSSSSRKRTLEELFRPPIDLTFKGSFHSARDTGTFQNKWLLVNVQNVQEFVCQALNRDIWSHAAVKSIVKTHFIFWQVYHDSQEGKLFTQFYKVKDWPFIAILDPRTGENVVTWTNVDSTSFCDLITEFLASHPSPDGSTNSPPCKKFKEATIIEAQEDDQMQAAIKASLSETVARSKKSYFLPDSDSECSDDLETFTDSDEEGDAAEKKSSPVKETKSELTVKSSTKNVAQSSDGIPTLPRTVTNELSGLCVSETCDTQYVTKTDIPDGANNNMSSNRLTFEKESQSWENYRGDENDPQTTIALRFPDGKRQQLSLPCSSTLKALEVYVIEQGYSSESYELVTCFPRKQLSQMDSDKTLKSAGLHPQDTVFVQAR